MEGSPPEQRRDEPAGTTPDSPLTDEEGRLSTQTAEDIPGTSVQERPPPFGMRTLQALAYRDFRYLWYGQIAQAGSLWIEQIARPVLVLALTGSPVHLGLVFAARTVPQLGVGLFSGVLADWYNRKSILLVSKTASAVLNFSLAILIISGEIELWHVYVQTVLKGAFNALDQPARHALIPSLVPRSQLTGAVAFNSATMNTMRIAGAGMAGLLLAVFGTGTTFMTAAFIFLGAVFFTTRMHVPPQAEVVRRNIRNAGSSLKEGLQYAWATPSIRWVMALAMLFFIFGMAYMQVFTPLFATRVLEIGDAGFGWLMATSGAGAMAGGLILASFNPQRGRGILLIGTMAIFGAMLILFSLSTYLGVVALSFGLFALVGMTQTPFFALTNAVLLDSTPAQMRGRVMALLSLDRSVITLGGAIAGFMAAGLGTQVSQIIFGALCVAGVLLLATLAPGLRRVQ